MSYYKQHLQSDYWKQLRTTVLTLHNNTCQCCKNQFRTYALHLHHKHYKTLGNESIKDVVLLCQDCHKIAHGYTPKRKVTNKKQKKEERKEKSPPTPLKNFSFQFPIHTSLDCPVNVICIAL